MKEQWFKFVVDKPFVIITLCLILIIIAASGASKLVFKSDYWVFFDSLNPVNRLIAR